MSVHGVFYVDLDDTHEYLGFATIVSNNYDYVIDDIYNCKSLCETNDSCLAYKTDSLACYVFSNIETSFLIKSFDQNSLEGTKYHTYLKFPNKNDAEITNRELVGHYLNIKTYSATSCYSRCLDDPRCHASSFIILSPLPPYPCYLYKRDEYKYGFWSSSLQFVKRKLNEVELMNNTIFTNSYRNVSIEYITYCNDLCYRDSNCKGYSFNRTEKYCVFVNDTTNYIDDPNSESYIKKIEAVTPTAPITTQSTTKSVTTTTTSKNNGNRMIQATLPVICMLQFLSLLLLLLL